MSALRTVAHGLRARQQELRVVTDDLWYAFRNGGSVNALDTGLEGLSVLAATRWKSKRGEPFHVVYVGQPWNWEEHNLPAEEALAATVTTWWLRDAGFSTYDRGRLVGRESVGRRLFEHLEAIDRERPVHVLLAYLSGGQIAHEDVKRLSSLGIVTCAFNWDDRLYFRGQRTAGIEVGPASVARAFDLNLTNSRRSLTKYAAIGARGMFWPEGANPDFFKPGETVRDHDVSFVGGAYGPRVPILDRLMKDGYSAFVRGPGWPGGEIPASEIPSAINRGRVTLGFSGIGRSLKASCLKGRDFEGPMCGAAYAASWNPDLPLVYEVGQEIATWRSYRDLRDTLDSLLADEKRLSELRFRGLQRARKDHTWAKRVEAIARVLGHEWRAPDPGSRD